MIINLKHGTNKTSIDVNEINKKELYLGPIVLIQDELYSKAVISILL
jgi:hypothetical protein